MKDQYTALAARAEAEGLPIRAGATRRGDAARAEATRLLMEATGAARVEDVPALALGRPRAGQETGPSPTVRARVTRTIKAQVTELAKREQRSESDVVREAVTMYVAARAS